MMTHKCISCGNEYNTLIDDGLLGELCQDCHKLLSPEQPEPVSEEGKVMLETAAPIVEVTLEHIKDLRNQGRVMEANSMLKAHQESLRREWMDGKKRVKNETARIYHAVRSNNMLQRGLCRTCGCNQKLFRRQVCSRCLKERNEYANTRKTTRAIIVKELKLDKSIIAGEPCCKANIPDCAEYCHYHRILYALRDTFKAFADPTTRELSLRRAREYHRGGGVENKRVRRLVREWKKRQSSKEEKKEKDGVPDES